MLKVGWIFVILLVTFERTNSSETKDLPKDGGGRIPRQTRMPERSSFPLVPSQWNSASSQGPYQAPRQETPSTPSTRNPTYRRPPQSYPIARQPSRSDYYGTQRYLGWSSTPRTQSNLMHNPSLHRLHGNSQGYPSQQNTQFGFHRQVPIYPTNEESSHRPGQRTSYMEQQPRFPQKIHPHGSTFYEGSKSRSYGRALEQPLQSDPPRKPSYPPSPRSPPIQTALKERRQPLQATNRSTSYSPPQRRAKLEEINHLTEVPPLQTASSSSYSPSQMSSGLEETQQEGTPPPKTANRMDTTTSENKEEKPANMASPPSSPSDSSKSTRVEETKVTTASPSVEIKESKNGTTT